MKQDENEQNHQKRPVLVVGKKPYGKSQFRTSMKSAPATSPARIGVLCLAAFTLITRAFAADPAAEWKVQIQAIRVVAVAAGDQDSAWWGLNGATPGVTVLLKLTAPEGNIVGINIGESKLVSFTDDQGTDLAARPAEGSPGNEPGISTRLGFGPLVDGKPSAIIRVTAPNQPARGAAGFSITGKVTVQTASQTNQVAAEKVALTSGTVFELGELKLTICDVRSKDGKCEVSLQSSQDLTSLAKLDFYDAQEQKIESQVFSSNLYTSGAEKKWSLSFRLQKTTAVAKIAATCWTDLKTVEVPIAVKTGVGL
jgi:hypothetical protein